MTEPTKEQIEAAARLAHNHGIHIHPCSPGNPRIQGHLADLAALIDHVRRETAEEICRALDDFARTHGEGWPTSVNIVINSAVDAIRAKYLTQGKEEGK